MSARDLGHPVSRGVPEDKPYHPKDVHYQYDLESDFTGNLPPDKDETGEFKVDESSIRLSFEGDSYIIEIPVERTDGGSKTVKGTASAVLLGLDQLLDGGDQVRMEAPFTFGTDGGLLVFTGSVQDVQLDHDSQFYNLLWSLGRYFIDWEVDWGKGSLSGRSSAWPAVDKLEVSLRSPRRFSRVRRAACGSW